MLKKWMKCFENVGEKIKRATIVFAILEMFASIIVGVGLVVGEELAALGWVLILLGPFAVLLIAWFIYGYGQLIENSDKLVQLLGKDKSKNDVNLTECYLSKSRVADTIVSKAQSVDSTNCDTNQEQSADYILPINSVSIFREHFKNNKVLTCAKIPPNIKTINVEAFCDCSNLKTVYFPKGIYYIGQGTFKGCTALTDVYFRGSKEDWEKIQIGDYNEPLLNAQIHYDYK